MFILYRDGSIKNFKSEQMAEEPYVWDIFTSVLFINEKTNLAENQTIDMTSGGSRI